MPGDIELTQGLAQRAVDQLNTALPALAWLRRAGEGAAVEVEVLLDELLREERRPRVEDLPGQPVLPRPDRHLGQRVGQGTQVVRLAHDHFGEGVGRTQRSGIPRPIDVRREVESAAAVSRLRRPWSRSATLSR